MNIKTLHPPSPAVSDWTEVAALQKTLSETVDRINAMAGYIGMAKHVVEYDGDRRKRALARAMAATLAGGSSAAAAEAEGRASESYHKEMLQLGKEHAAALQVIIEYDCLRLRWDTARSLLAMQRETYKL